DLAQHRGLPNARTAEQKDALAAEDEVLDHADGAVDGSAHAAGKANDFAPPVANAGDAMERAFDAGAVVIAKVTDVLDNIIDICLGHFLAAQHHFVAGIA